MAELLADVELVKKDGSKVMGAEALKDKTVALYFSAEWCPPCHSFTPVLKEFYDCLLSNGHAFEVVFITGDETEEAQMKYMNDLHGDWLAIPFGNEKIKELGKKYDVQGIPMLLVIKSNGDIVARNARMLVSSTAKKNEEEEKPIAHICPGGPAHHRITCNQCENEIHGIRYICKECEDYDTCSTCYDADKKCAEAAHEYFKIEDPCDKSWMGGGDPAAIFCKWQSPCERH